MSGDINVQTFSGKVNINNNLLVGTSHLFVDTVNNKVGITTTSPGANLEVNGNLHVVTDLTFGGTLTGDGSGLSNVNSDSGLWTGAGTGNVYLSTSTHNVGIGTSSPLTPLHISSANEITTSPAGSAVSQMRYGSTNSTVLFGVSSTAGHISAYDTSNFDTNRNLCFNADGGNVGIGTNDPGEKLHVNGNLRIGSSPNDTVDDDNNRYISTAGQLTIKANDSGLNGNYVNIALQAGKTNPGQIIIGGGTLDQYKDIEFYTCGSSTERMRIHHNGNVGIGTTSPATTLEVNSDARVSGGTYNSYVQINTGGSIWRNYNGSQGAGIHFTDSAVIPANHAGGDHGGNNIDLGSTSYKWRNLYINNDANMNNAYISNYASVSNQLYAYEIDLRQQRRVASYGTVLTWPNNGHHIDCYKNGNGHEFHINYYAQQPVLLNRTSYSDRRIKEDIRDIDDSLALETLRKIKPKTYRYKLKPDRGVVYGFIAQDVREILPYATNLTTLSAPFDREDFVDANILENGAVELTSPCERVEVGKNVLFFYESSITTRDFKVLEIMSSTQFKVEVDSLDKEWIGHTKLVGSQVSDFHGIDKDAIFTVATAALQEVDRQQQADKVHITQLERDLQTTQTQIDETRTQLEQALEAEKVKTKNLESRLAFIETAVASLIS